MICLVRCASLTLFVLSLQSAIFQSGNRLLAANPAQQTQSAAATNEIPIQNRAGATLTLQSNPLPQPATGIAAADFDKDGKPDLAILDSSGVSIFLSDGGESFHTRASYILPHSVSVAAADFNRDGRMDLAIARANGVVSILLGNGDGTFQPPVDYAAGLGPQGLAVGDFNRDGFPDLAVANTTSPAGDSAGGAVSILLGNGDGTFRPLRHLSVGSGAFSVATTDLGAAVISTWSLRHRGLLARSPCSVVMEMALSSLRKIFAPVPTLMHRRAPCALQISTAMALRIWS